MDDINFLFLLKTKKEIFYTNSYTYNTKILNINQKIELDDIIIEEIANVNTEIYCKDDLYFYKYNWVKICLNYKHIKKISSSLWLWKEFFNIKKLTYNFDNLIIFLKSINFNLTFNLTIMFLNWWGWKKNSLFFSNFFLYSSDFYFYKFFNKLQLLENLTKKTLNLKLLTVPIFIYYLQINNIFFIPYFSKQLFDKTINVSIRSLPRKTLLPKHRAIIFWSIPWIKLLWIIWKNKFLCSFFKSTIFWLPNNLLFNKLNNLISLIFKKTKLLNYKKLILQTSILNHLLKLFKNIKVNLLLNLIIFYLLLFLFKIFSMEFIIFCYYFLTIFVYLNFSSWLKRSPIPVKIFIPTIIPNFIKTFYVSTVNFLFFGYEWFICSHLFNNKLKDKIFYFSQGIELDIIVNSKFFNLIYFFSNFKINNFFLEIMYFAKKNYWFEKGFFKWKFYNFKAKSLIVSDKNFFFINFFGFKKKLFVSWFWFWILFVFLLKLKKLNFFHHKWNMYQNTLSYGINYSNSFNKKITLDLFSSINTSLFFYISNFYNLIFFYNYLNSSQTIKIFVYYSIITNFEAIFVWKFNIFKISYKIFRWLSFMLVTFKKIWMYKKVHKKKKFNFLLPKTQWFNYKFFIEELFHLTYLHNYSDLEWVQELVRSKQLAELRLIKLTNYLKAMREAKIDVGNIQYSPDFTQLHEFALTLKWGIELEQLKFSRMIILRRFFGTLKTKDISNYVRWKINFSYNLKKLRFTDLTLNWQALFLKTRVSNILSIKNVYELTWIKMSTIIASYWNIYRFRYLQLNFSHKFIKLDTELEYKSFYIFLAISFNWWFYIECYDKYYKLKKIKWWIWFHKMLWKKVFNVFIQKANFFFSIFQKNTLFNENLFLLFRRIRKFFWFKLWWTNFITLLYKLLIKYYWSFFLPSSKTLDDFQYYWNINEFLILKWTNKLVLIANNIISNNYILIANKDFFKLKKIIPLFIHFFKKMYSSFFFKKWIHLIKYKRMLELNLISKNFDFISIFKNFFSECWYELVDLFIKNFYLVNKSKKKLNFFMQKNIFSSTKEKNFSFVFYSYINRSEFRNLNWKTRSLIFLTFLNFFNFIKKKFILNNFFKNFKKFFFSNYTANSDFDFGYLNYYLINHLFLNKFKWLDIITEMYSWILQSLNQYNTSKEINIGFVQFFQLNTFYSLLELFFIDFLTNYIKIVFKN